MPRKSGPTKRDMFPGHGAGKGDAPRHKFNEQWRTNFDEINWPKSDDGFEKKLGKQTKRYGASEPTKLDKAPNVKIL